MNAKYTVIFEINKNERIYSLTVPIGSPLGEIHDALYEMIKGVIDLAGKNAELVKNQGETNDN